MHKSGLGLLVVFLSAVVAVANPAETQSRIQGHVQKKEYAKAIEVAQSIPDPVGRSMMLLTVAQAQDAEVGNFKADETFELAAEATRTVTNPSERALRLGTLAWIYERRFQNRLCRQEGDAFRMTTKLLEEAGRDVGAQGPSAIGDMLGAPGKDADQIHTWFVAATILHAAGSKAVAQKAMSESCVAVSRIERLDVRARLLMEAANMSRWMGDAEGGALRMRDARVFASGLEDLNARLGTLRTIAESYAKLGSADGVNATMPALLAGLDALPASKRDGKVAWLLALAKLQSKVGAHDAIHETLNRFDVTMATVVKAHGMNSRIREFLDDGADLRISSGHVDEFLAYAKQRCKTPRSLHGYYEQRVRWLLGLGTPGDVTSVIGARKPSVLDVRVGLGVADRIRIDSAPFRPVAGARFVHGKRDEGAEQRDRLFKDIVERCVKFEHLAFAEAACARLVSPSSMADALMGVARAYIEAGQKPTALLLLNRAWVCLEAQAPEATNGGLAGWADSALRGGNYSGLARLYHDAGSSDWALNAIGRVRAMYKRSKNPGSRYLLASYLTSAYYRIGDSLNAKRYCAQFVEIVAAQEDPFQALMDGANSISIGGYTDGARACFERALRLANDSRVAVDTRIDRYLKIAAGLNRILKDGSGAAAAMRATSVAAATADPEERERLLNSVVHYTAGIGAPQAFLAAFHHLRPLASDDARDSVLRSTVNYLCKRGISKYTMYIDGASAATALAGACEDPRVRASSYAAIMSPCFQASRSDDLFRLLERLRSIPASDNYRPEESISVALGELVAAYAKRHEEQQARELRDSCLARLVNAPDDESDASLARRVSLLASLAAEEERAGTSDGEKRATDAANTVAARISDAAAKTAALKRLS